MIGQTEKLAIVKKVDAVRKTGKNSMESAQEVGIPYWKYAQYRVDLGLNPGLKNQAWSDKALHGPEDWKPYIDDFKKRTATEDIGVYAYCTGKPFTRPAFISALKRYHDKDKAKTQDKLVIGTVVTPDQDALEAEIKRLRSENHELRICLSNYALDIHALTHNGKN